MNRFFKRNGLHCWLPPLLCALFHYVTHPGFMETALFWDDWDLLLQYRRLESIPDALRSAFAPHLEHFQPLLKILYYSAFHLFGSRSTPLHAVFAVSNFLLLFSVYGLVLRWTGKRFAAFFSCFLLAITHLFDEVFYWIIAGGHLMSASLFFLLLLYSARERSGKARLFGFAAVSLAFNFTLSSPALLLFPWIAAWLLMFPNRDTRKRLAVSAANAALLVALYLVFRERIASPRLSEANVFSAVEFASVFKALRLACFAFFFRIVPESLFVPRGIGSLIATAIVSPVAGLAVYRTARIHSFWIPFFLGSLGFSMLFFLFYARLNMGAHIVEWGRYYVYPVTCLYLLLGWTAGKSGIPRFLKPFKPAILRGAFIAAATFLLFLSTRHPAHPYPPYSLQSEFQKEVRRAVSGYLASRPENEILDIESFTTETALCFPRSNRDYFRIFLSDALWERVRFGNTTPELFLEYCHENGLSMALYIAAPPKRTARFLKLN